MANGRFEIGPAAPVLGTDCEVGRVDAVVMSPGTGEVTALVIRKGILDPRDIAIPIEAVEEAADDLVRVRLIEWAREIIDDRVFLDVGREQLERLPEYRPDEEITADVLDLLWYRSDLDADDLRYVEVRTTDGIAELSGLTRTERARAAIESLGRRVGGALGVRNQVKSFEALAEAATPWEHVREGPASSQHRIG